MMLTYQRTIQGAFRDVSDALVAYRKNREFRVEQEKLVEAARDSARLSELRFGKGETDYLEVLTNETNYFSAQLELTEAYLGELIASWSFTGRSEAAGRRTALEGGRKGSSPFRIPFTLQYSPRAHTLF